jgi:hypothetical protein
MSIDMSYIVLNKTESCSKVAIAAVVIDSKERLVPIATLVIDSAPVADEMLIVTMATRMRQEEEEAGQRRTS